jgi:hypothetical protein
MSCNQFQFTHRVVCAASVAKVTKSDNMQVVKSRSTKASPRRVRERAAKKASLVSTEVLNLELIAGCSASPKSPAQNVSWGRRHTVGWPNAIWSLFMMISTMIIVAWFISASVSFEGSLYAAVPSILNFSNLTSGILLPVPTQRTYTIFGLWVLMLVWYLFWQCIYLSRWCCTLFFLDELRKVLKLLLAMC